MDAVQELVKDDFVDLYSSSIIVFNIRFSRYVANISASLNRIENRFQEPYDTECEEQVIKRELKMAAEFGRNFSRVNLYSIQLKLKKLEKEIIFFKSQDCCKIAKAFILRSLILSLFKYLSNSVRIYLKFVNKCSIRVSVKLKELLNFISHSYEIIGYVVDHRSIEIHDLPRLCSSISDILGNQKVNLKATSVNINQISGRGVPANKRGINKMRARSYRKKVDVPKMLNTGIGESCIATLKSKVECEVGDGKEVIHDSGIIRRPKNVRFETCMAADNDESASSSHLQRQPTLENDGVKLCFQLSRVCEAVLNDLTAEIVDDISECVHSLALETFSREFSDSE